LWNVMLWTLPLLLEGFWDEHLRPEFQEVFDKAVNGEVELVSPDLLVYEIGNIS